MVSLHGCHRVVRNQACHACRARPDGGPDRGSFAGASGIFAGEGEPFANRLKARKGPVRPKAVLLSAPHLAGTSSYAGLTRVSIDLQMSLSHEDGWPGQARPRRVGI